MKTFKLILLACSLYTKQHLIHNAVPYEIRLRIAAKANTSAEEAALIGEEVEALYTNGPAGGGGARKYVSDVIGIVSTLIRRRSSIFQ